MKELTNKEIGKHRFVFNPKDNGGEQLSLETKFIANGDDGCVFLSQTIRLESYCNCVELKLYGINITSNMLRELANELDRARNNVNADLTVMEYHERAKKEDKSNKKIVLDGKEYELVDVK